MQLVGAVMTQERADEGKFPVFMMWSRARSGQGTSTHIYRIPTSRQVLCQKAGEKLQSLLFREKL